LIKVENFNQKTNVFPARERGKNFTFSSFSSHTEQLQPDLLMMEK
jgi:hypothetical protein